MCRTALLISLAVLLSVTACGETDGGGKPPAVNPTLLESASQPTATPEAATPVGTASTVGPDAVWQIPNADVVRSLQSCRIKEYECAKSVMEESGARPAAIEFFRQTQWLMAGFEETGMVDIAVIFDPWRANANSDYALVNGSPRVVIAETEGWNIADGPHDPGFVALAAVFSDLALFGSDDLLESVEESPEGGQTFIFQYSLADQCHACHTGYFQRAALDFTVEGDYIGPRLLGVCERTATSERTPYRTPVPGFEVCPLPESDVFSERAGGEEAGQ